MKLIVFINPQKFDGLLGNQPKDYTKVFRGNINNNILTLPFHSDVENSDIVIYDENSYNGDFVVNNEYKLVFHTETRNQVKSLDSIIKKCKGYIQSRETRQEREPEPKPYNKVADIIRKIIDNRAYNYKEDFEKLYNSIHSVDYNLEKKLDGNQKEIDKFINEINKSFKDFILLSGEDGKSPKEIADDLIGKLNNDNKKIIIINIEGKFGENCFRQEQKGVEILKWLRCKHKIPNPVILLSSQSNAELLKQKPENLIINSPGCYHIQLPIDFNTIDVKSFKPMEEEDWNVLKKYLKPAFSIEGFRHSMANWWGVKCLWDVHNIYSNDYKEYPDYIKEKLNNIDNVVAEFLYGYGIETINKKIIDIKNKINDINYEINTIKELTNEQIEQCNKKISELKIQIQGLRDENKKHGKSTENKNAPILNEKIKEKIDNEINKNNANDDLKVELDKLKKELDDLLENNKNSLFNNKVINQENLIEKKILLIDDKAEQGWLDIFKIVLKGANISGYTPKNEDKNNESISDSLKGIINQVKPDVILLDLRLFDEMEQSIKVNEMSGAILLKLIREDFPGIPVVMTTASNKAWTLKEMMNLGADGYWIKEGIDECRDFQDSVQNYINLINLINNATSKEYQDLKEWAEKVKELESQNSFWWEIKDWGVKIYDDPPTNKKLIVPNITNVKKEEVFKLIYSVLFVIRQNYLVTIMQFGYHPYKDEEWYLPSEVIQHLNKVIEIIHNYDVVEKNQKSFGLTNYNLSHICQIRNDDLGKYLVKIRNLASHYADAKNLEYEVMKVFFNSMIEYLKLDPLDKKNEKEIENLCKELKRV